MTMAVGSNNFIQRIFGSSTTQPAATASAAATTPAMASDSVQLSNTANPQSAGFFKRMGDSVGEMFSDAADAMGFGETYKLIEQEFYQVDFNRDGNLNAGEFMMATLNPFEFQAADRNYDGRIDKKEYVKYRKDRLEHAFQQKDTNGDRFLNTAEIGSVGRYYLAQRDPRLDYNRDGLASKREYVRAQITLGISVRDMLGF
jgi:hypothetical protein